MKNCRYSHIDFNHQKANKKVCIKDGWDNPCQTCVAKCAKCKKFSSRVIEFPIRVRRIENNCQILTVNQPTTFHQSDGIGFPVKIQLPDDKDNKWYDGICLGELPRQIYLTHKKKNGRLTINAHYNPAIYVPEKKKIYFGDESWWKVSEKKKPNKKKSRSKNELSWQEIDYKISQTIDWMK